ncbi:hypothetical protein [Candidatus Methylomicrobium oryzae]|jgi:hypothetical protein|uniref:hypothetical protein n=1 Tax=Candidatus Methylomicrobium oryzae TaxID=2802053 RepID=UPI001921E0E6|nr:hypothetical protein [Methylomicrobium sp. RS1]MBL1265999.1 hypothetical protein [Methylomicrobium sp. RS1]
MQPIRKVYQVAPDSIAIPEELRHQPVEIIIWPLTQAELPALNLSTRDTGKRDENLSNHA